MIDLSLLAPEWQVNQGQFVLSTSTQQFLPSNPRRFALRLTYFNNPSPPDAHVNIAFIQTVSNTIQFGLVMQALQTEWLDFPHHAAYVQQEFWGRDSGTNISAGGIICWTEVVQSAGPVSPQIK